MLKLFVALVGISSKSSIKRKALKKQNPMTLLMLLLLLLLCLFIVFAIINVIFIFIFSFSLCKKYTFFFSVKIFFTILNFKFSFNEKAAIKHLKYHSNQDTSVKKAIIDSVGVSINQSIHCWLV